MIRLLARFSPPPSAPSSEVRRVGLRNALLGAILAAFGTALVLSLDRLTHGALLDPTVERPSKLRALSGVPVVLGFVAMVTGMYRAVTGIHPERDGHALPRRIARLTLATAIAAVLLGAIVLALLRLV